jgi:hypothetical protein
MPDIGATGQPPPLSLHADANQERCEASVSCTCASSSDIAEVICLADLGANGESGLEPGAPVVPADITGYRLLSGSVTRIVAAVEGEAAQRSELAFNSQSTLLIHEVLLGVKHQVHAVGLAALDDLGLLMRPEVVTHHVGPAVPNSQVQRANTCRTPAGACVRHAQQLVPRQAAMGR